MAKATIEFDLENHDDKMAMQRALKSTDMALAIHSIEQFLFKSKERYGDNEQLMDFSDIISRIIFEHDIKTENLIE
jgi:hypothetical protein